MSIVIGSSVALVSVSEEFDPARGKSVTRIWEGTADAIYGIVSSLSRDQFYSVDDSESPKYRLTVRTPSGDDTQTGTNAEESYRWELMTNEIQRSTFESPIALAMPVEVVEILRRAPRSVIDGDVTYAQAKTDVTTVVNASTVANKTLLLNDALALLDYEIRRDASGSWIDTEYVLRLTSTVSSRYTKQISDVKAYRTYSVAQIIGEASINQTPLPDRLVYKLEQVIVSQAVRDINNYGGNPSADYPWRWLKKPSNEIQSPNQKIDITVEWVLANWFALLYPAA